VNVPLRPREGLANGVRIACALTKELSLIVMPGLCRALALTLSRFDKWVAPCSISGMAVDVLDDGLSNGLRDCVHTINLSTTGPYIYIYLFVDQ
jgi:hypothetical protein